MEDSQLANSGPMNSQSSNQTFMAGAAVVGAIAVLSAGTLIYKRQSATTVQPSPIAGTEDVLTSPIPIGTPEIVEGKFKQGTYEAIGEYISPGGPETVKVSLTLKEDKITDITFTPQATLPASVMFQGKFAEGYKALVIGKNIADVKLDKVSGSSLTPKGFNDALQKIMVQAS